MSSLEASVTLDDVFVVVAARRVPLAPELAGYLVLEIAEGASPRGGDVDPKSIFIGEEGSVAIVRPKAGDGEGDAEASVRAMLAKLLEGAGAQPAALAAATRRASGAGLPALARELEAALIPVNRAAARRALARFAREVRRVTLGIGRNASIPPTEPPPSRRPSFHPAPTSSAGPLSAPPSSSDRGDATGARAALRSEVEEAFGPASRMTPTPPPAQTASRPDEPASRVDDLVASFRVSGEGEQRAARELKGLVGLDFTPPPPVPVAAHAPVEHEGADVISLATDETAPPAPAQARRQELRSVSDLDRPVRVSVAKGLVALMIGGGVAVAFGVSWLRSQPKDGAGASPSLLNRVAAAAHSPFGSACRSVVTVTDVPPKGELFVREGPSPADVGPLPVGARAELLVTAEGYLAKRAVVPAGASWDNGTDGVPRYELPVQLDRAVGALDAWPPGDRPVHLGAASGPPGTVHVVAAPRGADVWRLVGTGPEAKVERPSCDGDIELLIGGGAVAKKRIRLTNSDFTVQSGVRSARVSAK